MIRTRQNIPSAYSLRLCALVALRIARFAFDLLLTASKACLSKPLAWFPGLCDTPRGIDWLAIDDSATICAILIDVT